MMTMLNAMLEDFGHYRRNRYQPVRAAAREESGDESLDRVCWSSALFQAINRDLGCAWAS